MNLIICIDNKGGYSFASRRQSRDEIQLKNMLEVVGENRLFINEYTSKLFDTIPENVIVSKEPLTEAENEDFCFIENLALDGISVNKVIIYRWNRAYPSDKKLPETLLFNKKFVSSFDFAGKSHEKITREIFE